MSIGGEGGNAVSSGVGMVEVMEVDLTAGHEDARDCDGIREGVNVIGAASGSWKDILLVIVVIWSRGKD